VSGFLDRAAKHCAETGADPDDFVRARLYPDMAPFHFQIEALTHHAVWGLEAVKTGVFAPPPPVGAIPFTDQRAKAGRRERRWRRSPPMRSIAGPARTWTLTSFDRLTRIMPPLRSGPLGPSLSRQRPSSSRSRYPTSISTPSPPTTSCVREVCRSESVTTR